MNLALLGVLRSVANSVAIIALFAEAVSSRPSCRATVNVTRRTSAMRLASSIRMTSDVANYLPFHCVISTRVPDPGVDSIEKSLVNRFAPPSPKPKPPPLV